jgi:hypothetical protein
MNKSDFRPRSGDWVEVKSAEEIGETLGGDGALDGLPFMPEMLEYCGGRFRVRRKVEKTCVEINGAYDFREFPKNDVVLLEGLRCSGGAHDGCQRMCMLFWKTAWLRKAEGGGVAAPAVSLIQHGLDRRLKTRGEGTKYFCQSTELSKASRSVSTKRRLVKCWSDVRWGNVGIFQMLQLIAVPIWRKMTKRIRRRLVGSLKRTPGGSLGLRPGEIVEVNDAAEIAQTLDARGRNRGLIFDLGLCKFSGKKFRVRNRLDQMISESTGEMRKVEGTVILENLHCFCNDAVGGCPRQDVIYWRDVWLKRVLSNSGEGMARSISSKIGE